MSYPMRAKGSKAKRKKLQVYVDIDEFSLCLQHTQSLRHKIAFLLAWGSGLRLSEVINVQKNNFNFKNNQLIVVNGKNSKDRIVPIPKGFKKEHLDHIPFQFDKRSLQKAWKRACINSGLIETKPDVHFHSLRHGFAVTCLKNKISLKAIQRMLGHSDLSTTGMYLNLCPEEIIEEYQEKF